MKNNEFVPTEMFAKLILSFIPGIGALFLFALMFDTVQTKYWRLFGLWITLLHITYLAYIVFYKLAI